MLDELAKSEEDPQYPTLPCLYVQNKNSQEFAGVRIRHELFSYAENC